MLENIKYINHLGEEIAFDGSERIFADYNDLRDYSWNYDSDNNVISNLNRKGVTKKSLPVKIVAATAEHGIEIRNKLYSVTDKDTMNGKFGRLCIGEYYMKCCISGAKKNSYLYLREYMEIELEVITDAPFWVKEVKTQFRPNQSGTDGLSYAKQYAYRYTDYNTRYTITNNTLAAAPFRMIIYGPCENPEIFVGTQKYKINVILSANEYLTLTAFEKSKTIIKTGADGAQENCFNLREKSVNVFEPIPTGTFDVTWDGSFAFDLIIFDRRSEPIWT